MTGAWAGWRGLIEQYRDRLDVTADTPVVTLMEGGTPLVYACHLSEATGARVWLKVEGANPTGSFKDRGMTMAISKAVEAGSQAVICASTGNTSASAAAYAAKGGLTCAVLVPDGKIALGKLAQALVHGAKLLQVQGNFDDCLDLCRALSEDYPTTLVNSVNPDRIDGQKTAAFEICDALGDAPDVHCLPVGNAGNITAYWKGYASTPRTARRPGVPACSASRPPAPRRSSPASGCPPRRPSRRHPDRQPRLVAAGAGRPRRVGRRHPVGDRPPDPVRLPPARAEGGRLRRARLRGERRRAAAGVGRGLVERGEKVVCTVTGNGLKDPDWAISGAPKPVTVANSAAAAATALGLA
jgi:threonine synthase